MTPTIGSHALLLQLTTNLVHNAIVHNLPEQGTVWVTTSVHPESVVLTVENTGEKLTPQLVSTLAEPFQRGTERIRTDHAGVGLGLAIVKSITQAHDGTLTLTPRAAGGLRVTVQLPAAPARPADDDLRHPPQCPEPASAHAAHRTARGHLGLMRGSAAPNTAQPGPGYGRHCQRATEVPVAAGRLLRKLLLVRPPRGILSETAVLGTVRHRSWSEPCLRLRESRAAQAQRL